MCTNAKGVRVAVAQQTAARDAAARSHAWRTVMPILFLGPVLVLIVALLVRAMFQPLQRLAMQLGERREDDLRGTGPRGAATGSLALRYRDQQADWPTVRALAQQRRFIADAEHELRSPMTAMLLQAERLAASDMPREAQNGWRHCRRACRAPGFCSTSC